VYPLSALTDVVSVRQTGTAPSFSTVPTPFLALSGWVPRAVGTVAFGEYLSLVYLTADRPEVQGTT
jgi:hypothetical protein